MFSGKISMSDDRLRQDDKFDKMLRGALRARSQPVRSGFADKVLKQVQALDEQKILAKVILQERLALAVCIIVPAAAAVVIFAFPQVPAATWAGLKSMFYGIAKQIALIPHHNRQFWAVLVAVIGFAGYSIFDLTPFEDRCRCEPAIRLQGYKLWATLLPYLHSRIITPTCISTTKARHLPLTRRTVRPYRPS